MLLNCWGSTMRRYKCALLMAVAVVGLASVASAADMPVKARPMAPPFSWTGCYVGGDVGVAWARDHDGEITTATGGVSPFTPLSSAKADGVKVGGYVGCNWQTSSLVFGVEGDGEWANLKGSTIFNTPAPSDFYETKIRSQESLRARVGYAFDRVLLYVTGGVAFANINEHDQLGVTGGFTDHSTTRTGWTAGAGVQLRLYSQLDWSHRISLR